MRYASAAPKAGFVARHTPMCSPAYPELLRNVTFAGVAVLVIWVLSLSYTSSVSGGRVDPKEYFPSSEQACVTPQQWLMGWDECWGKGEAFPLLASRYDRYSQVKRQMCMDATGVASRFRYSSIIAIPNEWPKADCVNGLCKVLHKGSAQ